MFLYDKVIVIDIEATCWEKGQIPENQEENIEIGISTNRLWKANVKNLSQISFQ
jgi:inhibitor of KinA sporulation pathway (predicted exonuclease)